MYRKSLSRVLFVQVMVFWSSYPCIIGWNRDQFRSEIITKPSIVSPTGRGAERLISIITAKEIRSFLRSHFGDPPRTPLLDLSESELLHPMDHLFLVRDQSDQIAGTIRYHYIGEFITSDKVYVVDAFCIHPKWRKRGVGDYLLTTLHRYANERGIPYAIFLKEGAPLSIFHRPMYTGWYRYRRLTKHVEHKCLIDLTIAQAYRIMDIYRSIRPNMMMIRNDQTPNQIWKWFRKDGDHILIGIQDTHQRIETDQIKYIGWITTWIESPLVTEERRAEAADAVADQLFPIFDYLWINEKWIGSSNMWKRDGAFHWYTYQWSTCVSLDVSYSMMM